jgi:DNA-binding transcriptional ArsR family regulator
MKHLDVLEQAGLVARRKTGRTVACSLVAAPLEDAMGWLRRHARFWEDSLDRLAVALERAP